IEAGTLLDLELEQLDQAHLLTRACGVSQRSLCVGEHDARGGDVQEIDTALREDLQEVDHVVVVDQRVGQRHERLDQELLSRHGVPLSSCAAQASGSGAAPSKTSS